MTRTQRVQFEAELKAAAKRPALALSMLSGGRISAMSWGRTLLKTICMRLLLMSTSAMP